MMMLNRTNHDILLILTKNVFHGSQIRQISCDLRSKKSLVRITCKKRVNYYGNKTNKPIGMY